MVLPNFLLFILHAREILGASPGTANVEGTYLSPHLNPAWRVQILCKP